MKFQRATRAFTLIELLVVIAIIGTLAAIGLPALRGFSKSNAMSAANRQMLDDLAAARQRAIANRTTVYVVFASSNVAPYLYTCAVNPGWGTPEEKRAATNIFLKQFNSYALFSDRSVGDQPGRHSPRYLTSWRTLPEGVFIPGWKFGFYNPAFNMYSRALYTNRFPLPLADSSFSLGLPCIGFDFQGRLISDPTDPNETLPSEVTLPLVQGSIFHNYDANSRQLEFSLPDVVQPANAPTNVIRIDGLTGRARLERHELQ